MINTPPSSSSSSPSSPPASPSTAFQPASPSPSSPSSSSSSSSSSLSTSPLRQQVYRSVTVTSLGSTSLIKSPSTPLIPSSPVNHLTSASAPLGMSISEGCTSVSLSETVSMNDKCSSAPAIFRSEMVRSSSPITKKNDDPNVDDIGPSGNSPVEIQFPARQERIVNKVKQKKKEKRMKKNNDINITKEFRTDSGTVTPGLGLRMIEDRLNEVTGRHFPIPEPIQHFQPFRGGSISCSSSCSLTNLNVHYGDDHCSGQIQEDDQRGDHINNHIIIQEEAIQRGIREEGESERLEMDRIRSTTRRTTSYESNMMYIGHGGHRSVHQIPIYVETFSGTTFEIQILPQETIYRLKMKLEEEEGILVSQQHLIWQGEELKDDFTLDEYGIGFGAILRLVLELRGGPLNNLVHNVAEESHSEMNLNHEAQSSNFTSNGTHRRDSAFSGLVIFQDGNGISMYSRQRTTGTSDRSSLGSADPFGKFHENQDDPESRINLIGIARLNEQRQRENDVLRSKMREIQSKMKSLALKRCKNLPGTSLIKLPFIIDARKDLKGPSSPLMTSSLQKSAEIDPNTRPKLLFPPLVFTQSSSRPTLQPILQTFDFDMTEEKSELRRIQSKLINQFNKKLSHHRSKCFSAKTGRLSASKKLDGKSSSTLKNENGSFTSFIYRNGYEDRPKTTPVTLIARNCFDDGHDLTSYQGQVDILNYQPGQPSALLSFYKPTCYPMSRKDSIKSLELVKRDKMTKPSESKSREDSLELVGVKTRTLPPVKGKSKKSNGKSKNHCFACKKKLGLATRYDCRCGQMFCPQHRYSETHDCSHDYKSEGRRLIALNNPVVKAPKLPKI